MRRDLRLIPPAPRQPRWPPALWTRWPLAFAAFVLAVYGGVITLMLFYAEGGKPADDRRLDRYGTRVSARVTQVDAGDGGAATPLDGVYYTFVTPDSVEQRGHIRAARGAFQADQEVPAFYLTDAPHINRLQGTRLSHRTPAARTATLWVVLPGLACLVAWLWSARRTRHLLRHGDVALAEILTVRRVRYVLPEMLHVTFRFRDHGARPRVGRHWVRAHSQLGGRLLASPPPKHTPVVHQRTLPARCRAVCADDFARATDAVVRDDPAPWLPKS